MTLKWYFQVLKQYATFSGRARRAEYWTFSLINIAIIILLTLVETGFSGEDSLLATVYSLATTLPGIAVSARRMHDIGRSGWWMLIGIIPILGWIWLLVLALRDSEPAENDYGPSPKVAVA